MFAWKRKVSVLAIIAVSVFGAMGSKPAVAANPIVVEYRATAWKSAHFDDVKEADSHYATMTKLGCQVKKGSHNGHYDISFVCPKWRRIALKTDDSAHQWEKWLKKNGFETKHAH